MECYRYFSIKKFQLFSSSHGITAPREAIYIHPVFSNVLLNFMLTATFVMMMYFTSAQRQNLNIFQSQCFVTSVEVRLQWLMTTEHKLATVIFNDILIVRLVYQNRKHDYVSKIKPLDNALAMLVRLTI